MSEGSVPGKVPFESLIETIMFQLCFAFEQQKYDSVPQLLTPLQLDAIAQQCRFWTGQPMTDIFRPTQPLDGRVVYRSKASAALTSAIHLWFGVFSVVLGTTGLIH